MDRNPEAPKGPFPDNFKQGNIFWIEPDPSRGSIPGSSHPHVIVQDDVFNRSRISTVIVCALTSNLNRATEPGNVLLEPGEGNLEKQSVVVVSQVSSLYKTRLGAHIGTLSGERVQQILQGMRFLQASFLHR
jgi:mRNA interferase MazF